jgi:hypothetical protein
MASFYPRGQKVAKGEPSFECGAENFVRFVIFKVVEPSFKNIVPFTGAVGPDRNRLAYEFFSRPVPTRNVSKTRRRHDIELGRSFHGCSFAENGIWMRMMNQPSQAGDANEDVSSLYALTAVGFIAAFRRDPFQPPSGPALFMLPFRVLALVLGTNVSPGCIGSILPTKGGTDCWFTEYSGCFPRC